MRHLIVLFALSILTACHTNTTTFNKPAENKIGEVQPDYKSMLNGDWVEPSYIDDLVKTKSPYKSQKALQSIVELNINTSEIKGDSLEIGAPSIHEGTSFFVFFKPGITAHSFPTGLIDYDNKSNFYELGYLISGKDTSVVIYHYNKDKKLLAQNEYRKVPKNSAGALQYMVNKMLVSGKYTTADTTGKSTTIELTNDGKVTGLPNFTTYYVLTDFVAGPENNLDQICFDINTKNQKSYAFAIKGNTINLYETKENEDSMTLSPGELKYKLIRQ